MGCRKADFDREVDELRAEIDRSREVALAFGSETRLHMIESMISLHSPSGLCVWQITAATNLSRPAVSHHLQILKRAGIVKVRREGTRNFYYFDAGDGSFDEYLHMLAHARALMKALPDRSKPAQATED